MIQPSYLKKGDTVAIIATARKVSKEEIQAAVAFFESYGLSVLLGKNLFETYNQYAGTDLQRTEDLQWALNDKRIKAIRNLIFIFFVFSGYSGYLGSFSGKITISHCLLNA